MGAKVPSASGDSEEPDATLLQCWLVLVGPSSLVLVLCRGVGGGEGVGVGGTGSDN